MNIVETCRLSGIRTIYVSSLICRPSYQREVNEINKLLKYYAGIYNFTYIDDGAITEDHLWKDGVHLNTRGMYELANIYAMV